MIVLLSEFGTCIYKPLKSRFKEKWTSDEPKWSWISQTHGWQPFLKLPEANSWTNKQTNKSLIYFRHYLSKTDLGPSEIRVLPHSPSSFCLFVSVIILSPKCIFLSTISYSGMFFKFQFIFCKEIGEDGRRERERGKEKERKVLRYLKQYGL